MRTKKEYLNVKGIYEKLSSGMTVKEIKSTYRTKIKEMEIAIGQFKVDQYRKVNDYMRNHPGANYEQIARDLNMTVFELQKLIGRNY